MNQLECHGWDLTSDSIKQNKMKELQQIDCNCSDCKFMVRNIEKTKAHKDTFEGLGFRDKLGYGYCDKFDKEVSFIPVTCQIHTQECFKHRK